MKKKKLKDILKENFKFSFIGGFGAFVVAHLSYNQALTFNFSSFLFRWILFFLGDMLVCFILGWIILFLYSLIQYLKQKEKIKNIDFLMSLR